MQYLCVKMFNKIHIECYTATLVFNCKCCIGRLRFGVYQAIVPIINLSFQVFLTSVACAYVGLTYPSYVYALCII